jgi:hypothetical protein
VVPGDITHRKTAERAISESLAPFGRIDTLINNAGVFVAKPLTQHTEADYAAALGVNLTGFFHMAQGLTESDTKVSTTRSSNRFALSLMTSLVFQKRSASDASSEIGHHRRVDVVGNRAGATG